MSVSSSIEVHSAARCSSTRGSRRASALGLMTVSDHEAQLGAAVPDAPLTVPSLDYVEVSHAERRVATTVAPRADLVDDRVGVERRLVGADLELDERISEHVHALFVRR